MKETISWKNLGLILLTVIFAIVLTDGFMKHDKKRIMRARLQQGAPPQTQIDNGGVSFAGNVPYYAPIRQTLQTAAQPVINSLNAGNPGVPENDFGLPL